ncbi:MAG: hypothetical protein E3K37_04985 [Candidatus Kuenenia sp.]|nr:hypothetical protein [Candidatus Kuenenia hertensis]
MYEYYYCKLLGSAITEANPTYINKNIQLTNQKSPGHERSTEEKTQKCPDYEPSTYEEIKKILDYLSPGNNDVFVDLGSGKGRAVFIAGLYDFKRVVGIEVDKTRAKISRNIHSRLKRKIAPLEIINADAKNITVSDATIYFIFNPFGPETLQKIIDNIRNSLKINSRHIRIVYFPAVHHYILEETNWLKIEGTIPLPFRTYSAHVWGNSFKSGDRIQALDDSI